MDSEMGGSSDWGCIHRLSLEIFNVGGPKPTAVVLIRFICVL
jgi:hypothetical protein